MKYLLDHRGRLFYYRRVPERLLPAFGDQTLYRVTLGLPSGSSEAEVAKAWSVAHEDFENICAMASNTNLEILGEVDLQKKARAYLAKNKMSPGILHGQEEHMPQELDIGLSIASYKEKNHEELTNTEKVHVAAYWMAVESPSALRRKTLLLSECWDIYATAREIDVSTRAGKRFYNRWKEWLVLSGDGPVSKRLVEEGLDRWVEKRETDGVTVATMHRELTVVAACIRLAVKKTRTDCDEFTLPPLKKQASKKRKVLTQEQQRTLVEAIVVRNEVPLAEGVALLLSLQGAMIASETQRLLKSSVHITGAKNVPHLIVQEQTKTQERKRIIPVSVGLTWLRQTLKKLDEPDCLNALGPEWAALSDSAVSWRMNRYMPKGFTSYCLRHSFRANSIASGSGINTALIAGWKSGQGVSEIMFDYGSEGLSQSEVLKGLMATSKQLNGHLLDVGKSAGLRIVR